MFALCVGELNDRKIHVYLVKDVMSVHVYEVKFLINFFFSCVFGAGWQYMCSWVNLNYYFLGGCMKNLKTQL